LKAGKMVKVGLQINAQLENIEELKTSHPDYSFFFKIKCTNCGEESEKWHDVTESERVGQNSRVPDGFNFYMKCKMCGRENSIDILENSNTLYTSDDAGKFKTIVIFDCRGAEPFEFSPRIGWIAKSVENGQVFENIDLSDDDWADYDEKNKVAVGISEFKFQFIKLKK